MTAEALPDLSVSLAAWMRKQREWNQYVYHPRKTDFSDFVRQKFLSDLLKASLAFAAAAQAGKVACDLNVRLEQTAGRARKLDLIVGTPVAEIGPSRPPDVLRKSKLARQLLSLEVKLCMTEHRKATSRLIDELLSSLDVVKAVAPRCFSTAVVIVNVSDQFLSPLKRSSPNKHEKPHEIRRLIEKIVERVPAEKSGGYDALAMVLVDTDNEGRFEVGSGYAIPAERTYTAALQKTAEFWSRRVTVR